MITPTTSTEYTATRPITGASDLGYAVDRPFARISWGSIFAGAFIALATQLVLTLIGTAVGLATLDPSTGDNPSATALGVGAGIWLLISSIISLLAGGYIAARLGGTFNGWLHGLTTWAVVTVLTIILLSTAVGGLIGTASGLADFAAKSGAGADVSRAARQAADRTAATARSTDAQTAEKAANRGAAGTGGAALGLILGAVAAAFGGRMGERHVGLRGAVVRNEGAERAASRG